MSFFDAEALIVARLQALGVFQKVYTAQELSTVPQREQITPAAHVIYMDYSAGPVRAQNSEQMIGQTWAVVVAVRNQTDTVGGGGVRSDAGPLLDAVLSTLLGVRLKPDLAQLKLTHGGVRPLHKSGFGYFPLLFETSFDRKRTVP